MKRTIAFLALSAASALCFGAENPCYTARPAGGRDPKFICEVPETPAPPSLLLGVLGMAGCGLYMARRRKARA
jgi:hypothetical protein